jgi:hypothetical protein
MAKTDWKSSISTPGTVTAGYYGDVNGTAYMLLQGLGTAYKMTAGTAQLAAGSVNVTTGLSRIVSAVASPQWGGGSLAFVPGTTPLVCVFLNGAGTLAIVSAPAGVILGTCYASWTAVGY